MIKHQMQLYRPLPPAELRPVIHAQTQINHRGVKAHQFVLETKLPFSACYLSFATVKEIEKDIPV